MNITGVMGRLLLNDVDRNLQVGTYSTTLRPAIHSDYEQVKIPCGFCRRSLWMLRRGRKFPRVYGRVIRLDGDKVGNIQQVIVDPIPKAYQVGHCWNCKAVFSWPANRPKWLTREVA